MGATLLDGVVVEKHSMVAAGALVKQNSRIPSGEVCMCTCSGYNVCLVGINKLQCRRSRFWGEI